MQRIGYPSNDTNEKLNRSWWTNSIGRSHFHLQAGGLEGEGSQMVSSVGAETKVDQVRRNWSQADDAAIAGDAAARGKRLVGLFHCHPTVLPIDKVRLEGSFHWSLENSDCRNQPPSMESRAVGGQTDKEPVWCFEDRIQNNCHRLSVGRSRSRVKKDIRVSGLNNEVGHDNIDLVMTKRNRSDL